MHHDMFRPLPRTEEDMQHAHTHDMQQTQTHDMQQTRAHVDMQQTQPHEQHYIPTRMAQRCHVLKAKMVIRLDVQEQEMPMPAAPSQPRRATWMQRIHVYW